MKTTLYLLPHAGGASYAYHPLAEALAPDLEVCCLDLPGHGVRAGENPLTDMQSLAKDLLHRMAPSSTTPWALFGHSMGALLAHAICDQCRHQRIPMPVHLFVSGTAAPQSRRTAPIAHLSGKEFWQAVTSYGGVPAQLLDSSELMDYFEELLRFDFQAVEGYAPQPTPQPVPITVLYGRDDMSKEEANSWQAETNETFQSHAFNGGHFFLFDSIAEITCCLREELEA